SEDERSDHGAGEVRADGRADLRIAEAQRVGIAEHARDRADERDLEPVEEPRDAERDDDAPVPATPRQTVEPRGEVSLDEAAHMHEDASTRDLSHAAFARTRALGTHGLRPPSAERAGDRRERELADARDRRLREA